MLNISDLALPIIQAPMAGGPSTPALAAEVSKAGGLGSLGFAYSNKEKIIADLKSVRAITKNPVNANFFIFTPVELPPSEESNAILAHLSSLSGAIGFELNLPHAPFYPNLSDQLEAVWQEKPEVLTFHFGLPNKEIIQKAHAMGITVGITATQISEALEIQAIGADFIIAQGIEAGGHRGVFNPKGKDKNLSVFDLVSQLKSAVQIPIVAAGGIMNGGHINEALNRGAVAAQMGTAFLTCTESGASPAHQDYLLHQHDRGTAMTRAYSGRSARGIVTEFMNLMQHQPTLPFPIQNSLTGAIRQAAVKRNDAEYQSLWAGSNYYLCQAQTAAELMQKLASELLKA